MSHLKSQALDNQYFESVAVQRWIQSLDSKGGVRGHRSLRLSSNSGGDLPLGCEMQWQLWCQNPESGYAQCTLPSSRTTNKRAKKEEKTILRCSRVRWVGVNGGLED